MIKRMAIGLGLALSAAAFGQMELEGVENGTVFFEEGRFGGWPANNGIWHWGGDEIVVGFTLGYYDPEKKDGHPIDAKRPSHPMQARSLDGGDTWTIEQPNYVGEGGEEGEPKASPGGFDFTAPGAAVRFRGNRFYYSDDRCKTWQGPFLLPEFDRPGLLARTDYIVKGKHELMAFLASEKDDGEEGWVFCMRTADGGKTWDFVGWIGEQPGEGGYAIMPASLELKNGALLSIIRRRGQADDGTRSWWMEGFLSPDQGKSWYLLKEPYVNNDGNPPAMVRMADGRIALAYGHRAEPYGIRGRVSDDEGMTWSDEFIIRNDGGSWDIGYPRMIQRPDGKLQVFYYYVDAERPERYIAYSIWSPPAAE